MTAGLAAATGTSIQKKQHELSFLLQLKCFCQEFVCFTSESLWQEFTLKHTLRLTEKQRRFHLHFTNTFSQNLAQIIEGYMLQ